MKNSLRPRVFKDFIGQERLVKTIKVIIDSSKKRKKQMDHLLFYGPPGLGKTSLVNIIGNEISSKIRYVQGPMLEKKADVLSLFCSLTKGDILFIDEFHGINRTIEELFYSAIEDKVIDVMIGPDGDQKIIRMNLPDFTLIGATTIFSKISQPLRDRFGFIGKFVNYKKEEVQNILKNSSKILKVKIDDESIELIANNSRFTPRIANNILKRAIDFTYSNDKKSIDLKIVEETFENIGVYKYGLTDMHVFYLKCLAEVKAKSRWISLNNIIGLTHEDKNNIEITIEPILISKMLIEKSSNGRRITEMGIQYLDINKF